jgi:hypothetical protein
MAPKALPSPEVLRQLLRYEPETGKLFWKPRTEANCVRPAWFNAKNAGKEAFTATVQHGYRVGLINRTTYQAHRVIWAMQTGDDPGSAQIDHVNRDPSDNRIENLRLATSSQNQANKVGKPGSSSRYKGVNALKGSGLWQGTLRHNKTRLHLGTFRCETAAAIAYDKAAMCLYGEFALTNYRIEAGNDT